MVRSVPHGGARGGACGCGHGGPGHRRQGGYGAPPRAGGSIQHPRHPQLCRVLPGPPCHAASRSGESSAVRGLVKVRGRRGGLTSTVIWFSTPRSLLLLSKQTAL